MGRNPKIDQQVFGYSEEEEDSGLAESGKRRRKRKGWYDVDLQVAASGALLFVTLIFLLVAWASGQERIYSLCDRSFIAFLASLPGAAVSSSKEKDEKQEEHPEESGSTST